MPPSAPIEGYIWEDANYDGIRQEDVYDKDGNLVSEGERGIGGVRIRPTKYYLDDTDKTGGPDGTWKRTYSLDEDGNRVLDPYYPFTTSYGTDPEEDLSWASNRQSTFVPTSFKKPDAQKLGEARATARVVRLHRSRGRHQPGRPHQQVPNEAIAGYTPDPSARRGRPGRRVAAGDAEGMRTESDAFRYTSSRAWTPSTAPPRPLAW